MKTISVVIPAYNEASNIEAVFCKVRHVFDSLADYAFEVIFVNDGSSDGSGHMLQKLAAENTAVKYIEFSRNFGHQLALKAGMDHASGDAVISMDCDMQHPPEMIGQMIAEWEQGYDIVFTLRSYAKKTPRFKRCSSRFYYKFINTISDVKIEEGSADFRLLDRSVVNVLNNIEDKEPFLRGLTRWVGFSQKAIYYTADERFSGESKYSLKKMLRLAMTGITSFSTKPLHIAVYLGFFFAAMSLLYIPYVIWSFVYDVEISGWASLIMTIVFFGGLQLVILGILGIYIGKIFKQTKNRPAYIIKNKNF